MRLNLSRIQSASRQLWPVFSGTPQYECEALSEFFDCEITLKVETLNPLRCFKGRGSQIAVSRAIENGHEKVVCASAGNLGQAIAYCAREKGIRSTIVASRKANALKLERISQMNAALQLVDGDIESARELARYISREENSFLIEDSENIGTCEGAGTIGIELIEGHPTDEPFDQTLIALGGGAMATGIGFVFKQLSPMTEVICVQPSGAPAMTLSWRAKTVVNTETTDTIADGVAGRFPIPEVLVDLLEVADDALLVEEASIVRGIQLLFEHAGLVAEPSAALGIAALLENRERFAGKRIAIIVCGSNVDPKSFHTWISGGR